MVEDGKEKRIMGREARKVEGRQTTNGAAASEGKKSGWKQHFRDCLRAGSLQLLWSSRLVLLIVSESGLQLPFCLCMRHPKQEALED